MALLTVGAAALGILLERLLHAVQKEIRQAVMFRSTLNKIKEKLESLKPLVDKISNMNDEMDLPQKEIKGLELKMSQGVTLVEKCSDVKNWEIHKRRRCSKKLRAWEKSLKGPMELLKLQGVRDGKMILKYMLGCDGRINKGSAAPGDLMMMNGLCSVPDPPSFIVGLDDSLKDLKAELLVKDRSVLVLTGPGGSGKTTLATMFCQDYEVKEKFKIFFVKFSKNPSLNLIVQRLFQHNGYKEPSIQDKEEELNMLIMFLKEIGKDHPILLVLDDVWPGLESQSLLLKLLPTGKEYKVLVTSRSKLFDFPSYHLEPLHDEDAMTLFKHYASLENCPNTRDDLAKEIVERCKRFPLALQFTGGALSGRSREIWQSKLEEWSTGSSILNNETELLDCLKSCLDFLEGDNNIIKECFLDLGAFPKDVRIPAAALIDIWTELHGVKQDYQAIANLEELTTRTLTNLVVTRRDTDEGDCYYSEHFVTQHDILRDLAIHQSNEDPERKRLLMEFNGDMLQHGWKGQNGKPLNTRLLAISTDGLFSSDWSTLKDLTLPKPEVLVLNLETENYVLPEFVENADELKVLIITNFGFFHADITNFELLKSIPNLKRIRLERIAIYSLIEKLEQAELGNLQKLSLFTCKFDQAFSDIAIKISDIFPNLVEINIDYCDDLVELPAGLCDIVSLKKLSITHCHKLSKLPEEIGYLDNLEVLRLRSCIDLTELPDSICKLYNLTFLDISDCFSLQKLPEDIGKLCSLNNNSLGAAFERLLRFVEKTICVAFMFRSTLNNIKKKLESLKPLVDEIFSTNNELDLPKSEIEDLQLKMSQGVELVMECLDVKKWEVFKRTSCSKKLRAWEKSLKGQMEKILNLLNLQRVRDGKMILKYMQGWDGRINKGSAAPSDLMMTNGLCSVPDPPSLIVGLNDSLKDLKVELLMKDSSVLVLTGPGGSGKTTLATMFCQDYEVKEKFEIFFVKFTKNPSLNLIVQRLFQHNGYKEPFIQDKEEALNMLINFLKKEGTDHPILLVLDDVWSGKESESLFLKLQESRKEYKVLVTSRSKLKDFPSYQLEPLCDEDAVTLFKHYASLENGPDTRDDLVKEIVERCKRFPLALQVTGGALHGQSRKIWQSKLEEWSTGSSILNETELLDRLVSSLDFLDGDNNIIKECFLDLGAFPKDVRIPAAALIDIWTELHGIKQDYQAIANLEELTARTLINLVVTRRDTDEGDCYYSEHFVTQHDILRDLAIHQSNEDPERKRLLMEFNGDMLQNGWKGQNGQPLNTRLLAISTDGLFSSDWSKLKDLSLPKPKVLVLNLETEKYALPLFVENADELKVLIITNFGFFHAYITNFELLKSIHNLKRIRLERIVTYSLIEKLEQAPLVNLKKISLFMCKFDQAFSDFAIKISDIFPNLGEINIDYCDDLVELPTGLCDIVSLKKLSITHCHKLSKLPEEIGNLVNLEVLRLRSCIDLTELPDSICMLYNLTFLDISDCFSLWKLPEDIGKLCSLRTLNTRSCSRFSELPSSIVDLEQLKEVICDEELKELWDLCFPDSTGITLRLVKDDINLNWL